MAISSQVDPNARKRILANVQERKKTGPADSPYDQDSDDPSRMDAAERILSRPVQVGKRGRKKRRRRPAKGKSVAHVVLLGMIGITGIAAIIGLRYMAEAFGVRWLGD